MNKEQEEIITMDGCDRYRSYLKNIFPTCKKSVDEMSKDESKKEKKFAKKVVQPGVQMDDDDMSSPVAFNEAEAHALIGDKPIVEDQKSQIEMANDFSNTTMNNDALKALEDDDNI